MPLDPTILKRLKENDPMLTSLNLTLELIGADGAKTLSPALKDNRPLISLDLGDNQVQIIVAY